MSAQQQRRLPTTIEARIELVADHVERADEHVRVVLAELAPKYRPSSSSLVSRAYRELNASAAALRSALVIAGRLPEAAALVDVGAELARRFGVPDGSRRHEVPSIDAVLVVDRELTDDDRQRIERELGRTMVAGEARRAMLDKVAGELGGRVEPMRRRVDRQAIAQRRVALNLDDHEAAAVLRVIEAALADGLDADVDALDRVVRRLRPRVRRAEQAARNGGAS